MSGTFISPTNLTKEATDLLNEIFRKHHFVFKIRDQSQVDGEIWYTVSCIAAVAKWIRSQDREIWHEHINGKRDVFHNTFDIHEKLYTLLALKWS